jgi:hypothetical protein
MAKDEDPKAPYTVRARLHRGGAEESLGTANTMEEAEALAETAVHTGPYAIAHIYDRDSRHVQDVGRQSLDYPRPSDGGGDDAA